MNTDYKNWVPKGLIGGLFAGAALSLVIYLFVSKIPSGNLWGFLLKIIVFAAVIVLAVIGLWMLILHRRFSYSGKRQLSRQIIDGIAKYVNIPDGGIGLDIGCGSGALAIACAKRNPKARIVGLDRWGKEYASFSKTLCENNAKAEKAENVTFEKGDALKLRYKDESFDAVFSNYVYHNIPSKNRQVILLETLRVLKKGGIFVIHDIFSRAKYGNIKEFAEKLKKMGYEEVRLVDTADGTFMSKTEAIFMGLSGSALLVGRK
ncbi:MAG: methyltransferase domain-containing protein [Clostridia bacterium]|nr:methyltransferase domain-containing protein [Clostridia bacterium]